MSDYQLTLKTLNANNIELVNDDEVFKRVSVKWKKYYVSNYGRVLREYGENQFRFVKPSINKQGYPTITLSRPARKYNGHIVKNKYGLPNSKRECHTVGRLVAMAFVQPMYLDYQLDQLHAHHLDHDKFNNYYKNLVWLSQKHHKILHNIKWYGTYSADQNRFWKFRSLDNLLDKLGLNLVQFLDVIQNAEPLFKNYGRHGRYVYQVGDSFFAVEFYDYAVFRRTA